MTNRDNYCLEKFNIKIPLKKIISLIIAGKYWRGKSGAGPKAPSREVKEEAASVPEIPVSGNQGDLRFKK